MVAGPRRERLSVIPAVAQVTLPSGVWPGVLIMGLVGGGWVGCSTPEQGVASYVPGLGGG